ncbi:hypothetical protein ACSNOK_04505 [Streptomyces sp. URMC 126]|uniref:hypothetical protein n=1 Tax=Streptomyces sp. URMC 126 TaxID=3423401 RepID=UPI003F19FF54
MPVRRAGVPTHQASTRPACVGTGSAVGVPWAGLSGSQKPAADQRHVLHNTDLITLLPDLTTDKRQVAAEELCVLPDEEFGVALDDEDSAALIARYA